jgi:hypothetical protein
MISYEVTATLEPGRLLLLIIVLNQGDNCKNKKTDLNQIRVCYIHTITLPSMGIGGQTEAALL